MAIDENEIRLDIAAETDIGDTVSDLKKASDATDAFQKEVTASFEKLLSSLNNIGKGIQANFNAVTKGVKNLTSSIATKELKQAVEELKAVNTELNSKLDFSSAIQGSLLFGTTIEATFDAVKTKIEMVQKAYESFIQNIAFNVKNADRLIDQNINSLRAAKDALDKLFADQDSTAKRKKGVTKRKIPDEVISKDDLNSVKKNVDDFYAAISSVSAASPFIDRLQIVKQVAKDFADSFIDSFQDIPGMFRSVTSELQTAIADLGNVIQTFSRRMTLVNTSVDRALDPETKIYDNLDNLVNRFKSLNSIILGSVNQLKPSLNELKDLFKSSFKDANIQISLPPIDLIKTANDKISGIITYVNELKKVSPDAIASSKNLELIGKNLAKFQDVFYKSKDGASRTQVNNFVATLGEIKTATSSIPGIVQNLNVKIKEGTLDNLVVEIKKLGKLTTESIVKKVTVLRTEVAPALKSFSEAVKNLPPISKTTFTGIVSAVGALANIGKQGGSSAQAVTFIKDIQTALTSISLIVRTADTVDIQKLYKFITSFNRAVSSLASSDATSGFVSKISTVVAGFETLFGSSVINVDATMAEGLKTVIDSISEAMKSLSGTTSNNFSRNIESIAAALQDLNDVVNTNLPNLSILGNFVTDLENIVNNSRIDASADSAAINLHRFLVLFNSATIEAAKGMNRLRNIYDSGFFYHASTIFSIVAAMPAISNVFTTSAANLASGLTVFSVAFANLRVPSIDQIKRLETFANKIPVIAKGFASISGNFTAQAQNLAQAIAVYANMLGVLKALGSNKLPSIVLPSITGQSVKTYQNFLKRIQFLEQALLIYVNQLAPLVAQSVITSNGLSNFAKTFSDLGDALNRIKSVGKIKDKIETLVKTLQSTVPLIVQLGGTPNLLANANNLALALDRIATSLNNVKNSSAQLNLKNIQQLLNTKASGASGKGSKSSGKDQEAFLGQFNRVNEILPTRGPLVQLTGTLFLLEGAFAGVSRAFENLKTQLIGANIELEQITITLATTLGTLDQAGIAVNDFARKFAAQVPFFEFKDISDAIGLLAAEGFSLSKLTGDTANGFKGSLVAVLADQAAAFGTSLDQSVDAFISAVQGRFVKERSFGVSESLLQQFGFSGLRSDAEGLANALERVITVRFGGLTKTLSGTFRGAVSNIQDLFTVIKTNVSQGIFESVRDSLVKLADTLSDLTDTQNSARGRQFATFMSQVGKVLGTFTQATIDLGTALLKYKDILIAVLAVPVVGLVSNATVFAFQKLTDAVLQFTGVMDKDNKFIGPIGKFKKAFESFAASKAIATLNGQFKVLSATLLAFSNLSVGGGIKNMLAPFKSLASIVGSNFVSVLKIATGSLFLFGQGFVQVFKILALPLLVEVFAAIRDIRSGLDTIRTRAFKQFVAELQTSGKIIQEIFNDIGEALGLAFNIDSSGSGVLGFATTLLRGLNQVLLLTKDFVTKFTNIIQDLANAAVIIFTVIATVFTDFAFGLALLVPDINNAVQSLSDSIANAFNPIKNAAGLLRRAALKELQQEFSNLQIPVDLTIAFDATKVASTFTDSLLAAFVGGGLFILIANALQGMFLQALAVFGSYFTVGAGPIGVALAGIATSFGTLFSTVLAPVLISVGAIIAGFKIFEFFSKEQIKDSLNSIFPLLKTFKEEVRNEFLDAAVENNLLDAIIGKETDAKKAAENVRNTIGGLNGLATAQNALREAKAKGDADAIAKNEQIIAQYKQLRDALFKIEDKIVGVDALLKDPKFFSDKQTTSFIDKIVGSDKQLNDKVAVIEKAIQRAVDKVGELTSNRSNAILNDDVEAAKEFGDEITLLSADIIQARSEAIASLTNISAEARKIFTVAEKRFNDANKRLGFTAIEQVAKVKDAAKKEGVDIGESLSEEIVKGTNFEAAINQLKALNPSLTEEGFKRLTTALRNARNEYQKNKVVVDDLKTAVDKSRESFNNAENQIAKNAKSIQNFIEVTYEDIKAQREIGQTSVKAAYERVVALGQLLDTTKALSDNIVLQRQKVKELVDATNEYVSSLKDGVNRQKALGRIDLRGELIAATRVLKNTVELYQRLGENAKNIKQVQDNINSGLNDFRSAVNNVIDKNIDNLEILNQTATVLNQIKNSIGNANFQNTAISKALEGFNVRKDSLTAVKDIIGAIRELSDINAGIADTESDFRAQQLKLEYLGYQIAYLKDIQKQTKIQGLNEEQIVKLQTESMNTAKEFLKNVEAKRTEYLKSRQDSEVKLLELKDREIALTKEQDKLVDEINEKRRKGSENVLSIQEKIIKAVTNKDLPANLQRSFTLARFNLLERSLGTVKDNEKRTQLLNEYTDLLGFARKEQLLTQDEFNAKVKVATENLKKVDISKTTKDEVKRLSQINDELRATERIMEGISNSIDRFTSAIDKLNNFSGTTFKAVLSAFAEIRNVAMRSNVDIAKEIQRVLKEKGVSLDLSNESVSVLVQIAKSLEGAKDIEKFRELAENRDSVLNPKGKDEKGSIAGAPQSQSTNPRLLDPAKADPNKPKQDLIKAIEEYQRAITNKLSLKGGADNLKQTRNTVIDTQMLRQQLLNSAIGIEEARKTFLMIQTSFDIINGYNRRNREEVQRRLEIQAVSTPFFASANVAEDSATFNPQSTTSLGTAFSKLMSSLTEGLKLSSIDLSQGVKQGLNDFFTQRPLDDINRFEQERRVATRDTQDISNSELIRLVSLLLTETSAGNRTVSNLLDGILRKDMDIDLNLVANLPAEGVNSAGNRLVREVVALVMERLQLESKEDDIR